ncbi:MAG: Asp-tRNA(Asn)/Glu-tRNA(Gln) amidotransferase subunit GatC [Candidatus Krumholzibacteriia bacterium]
MKIDEKILRHLEVLSRIDLTDDERERLAAQLDRIVGYVEQLQAIDTKDVAPTSAVVHSERGALRKDEPGESLDRDAILGQAPDATNGFFRVPKVIER